MSLLTTTTTFYAFVLPGNYTSPAPGVSFRITVLAITYNTTFANFSVANLQAGMKYVYNVSVGLLALSRSENSSPPITIALQEIVPMGETTDKQPF